MFDEKRYFVPGTAACSIRLASSELGLSVCEDAWHDDAPFDEYARTRPRIVLNINGSPYHHGKGAERLEIARDRAHQTGAWFVYVNAVGGQDELVFDGGSMVVSPDGQVVTRAAMFEEELAFFESADLEGGGAWSVALGPPPPPWPTGPEEVYRALVLGLGDYVRKNGFREIVVGMSGGIDSALVATLAADALGPDAVRLLAMPSEYSSRESVEDASRAPAARCPDRYRADHRSVRCVSPNTGRAVRRDRGGRCRGEPPGAHPGNLLMALSNKFGSIVLATGNKSEYAVGYATLYGDMAGGFAPIKDVPKTLVYELAALAERAGFRRAADPRADLDEVADRGAPPEPARHGLVAAVRDARPDHRGVRRGRRRVDAIVARGFDRATVERVARMIDRAEYKRRQAAPGVKITPKAFGRDRRLPITNRYGLT